MISQRNIIVVIQEKAKGSSKNPECRKIPADQNGRHLLCKMQRLLKMA